MARAIKILGDCYRDSVLLMQLSADLTKIPGLKQASAIMATKNNLDLLREVGLVVGQSDAGPNDLLIALEGDSDAALATAMAQAEVALTRDSVPPVGEDRRRMPPRSIEMGLEAMPAATLALISAPGEYAAAEALKALHLGLNVLLFSDNVSHQDERALKQYAREHQLMVMGPDCGSAIIDGIPLGFANVVRRGHIGVVAASGTGLQQVSCLIDRMGSGISQAVGTGGRDLHEEVGGISTQQALQALAVDPDTHVIVLISKPPARQIAQRILELASRAEKPVVANFIGAQPQDIERPNVYPAKTLEDAAQLAVALTQGHNLDPTPSDSARSVEVPGWAPSQRYIRGLYSGGTFCYEASLLLGEAFSNVHSNTPVAATRKLDDVWQSREHTLIDLGDDLFTRGRPHPMIDHRLRNERISKEARDPEVAVIVLDVVLGYGSHPDPSAEMWPVLKQAQAEAAQEGRQLILVGFVCGTAADPQGLSRQEATLRDAGMILTASNAEAVRVAAQIVARVRAPA
jgi:FdrA protein